MTSALQPPEIAAEWRGVSVRYPYQSRPVIDAVDLKVRRGERLLLLGPSGSGKTTLLATLTGLAPRAIPATVEGRIEISGVDVSTRDAAGWAADVAFLFQDADQTLCGMTVADEIAFALENRATPEAEIKTAIASAMTALGIPDGWLDRRTATLSGGEKQLVAIAAAIAQGAGMLVADEPTANLAPEAADRLRGLVEHFDGSVLLVDHRLDRLVDQVNRIALLDRNGRLIAEGPPRSFFRENQTLLETQGVWRPTAARLDAALQLCGVDLPEPPLTMDEAMRHMPAPGDAQFALTHVAVSEFVAGRLASPQRLHGQEQLALRDAACAPLFGPVVMHNVSLSVRAGETVAILGRNGAGKSTLAATLAGLLRPNAGKQIGGPAGMSFQNPENQFTAESVRDELASVLKGHSDATTTVGALLATWGLHGLADRHPFELSYGQKRRLALATLTADGRWPCLVLDEPTAGLDFAGAENLATRLDALANNGRTIVMVTHDIDFAVRLCERAIVVADATIVFDGPMNALIRQEGLLRRAGLEQPSILPVLQWLEQGKPC